jgi:hypothetical protein
MDQNGPPIPSSDFLLRSAYGQTPADIDLPPKPSGNDPSDAPSVALYYRNEEEVREGFLIALRAMGIADVEQHPEPAMPPVRGAKP